MTHMEISLETLGVIAVNIGLGGIAWGSLSAKLNSLNDTLTEHVKQDYNSFNTVLGHLLKGSSDK